jgi:hypothetical protein
MQNVRRYAEVHYPPQRRRSFPGWAHLTIAFALGMTGGLIAGAAMILLLFDFSGK